MAKKENEKMDKDELLKEVKDKLEKLSVKELVSVMATDLASVGFRKLDPKQKDLDQAKLAIDTLDALYKVLETHLTKEEKEVLRSALANLKMIYVKERK